MLQQRLQCCQHQQQAAYAVQHALLCDICTTVMVRNNPHALQRGIALSPFETTRTMASSNQHAHCSKGLLCHQVPLEHPLSLLNLVLCAVAAALQQSGLANHQVQTCQLLVNIVPVNSVCLIHWRVDNLQHKDWFTSHAVQNCALVLFLEPNDVCLLHGVACVCAFGRLKI